MLARCALPHVRRVVLNEITAGTPGRQKQTRRIGGGGEAQRDLEEPIVRVRPADEIMRHSRGGIVASKPPGLQASQPQKEILEAGRLGGLVAPQRTAKSRARFLRRNLRR